MISRNAQAYVLQRTENLQEQIELKAGKDDIISTINLSQEGVAIQGDKIDLTGAVSVNDNVFINAEGKITAVDGTFSGTVVSNSATITGGTVHIDTESADEDVIRFTYGDNYSVMSPSGFNSYNNDNGNYVTQTQGGRVRLADVNDGSAILLNMIDDGTIVGGKGITVIGAVGTNYRTEVDSNSILLTDGTNTVTITPETNVAGLSYTVVSTI